MTRFLALGASVALSVFSLAASAVTLEAIRGSAPQTTRAYAYFPQPIGVIVRDDHGRPIAGATVQFTFEMPLPESPSVIFMGDGGGLITTNAHGVALLADGVVAGEIPGSVDLQVFFPDAAPLALRLSIQPGPAVTLPLVSGDGQTAVVGALFAQPWVVRALDANGLAVPYASVDFDARGDADHAQATFRGHDPGAVPDGHDIAAVMADASGIATSPRLRASWAGHGRGYASAIGADGTNFEFDVVGGPVPSGAQPVSAPPLSIESDTDAIAPFVVRVLDSGGNGLAGVPVTFDTLQECGRFGPYGNVITVPSVSNGRATSPLYVGTGDDLSCPIRAQVGGLPAEQAIKYDMYIFRAENVHMEAPQPVVTRTNRTFNVDVAFSANGNPIYGLPVAVEVITSTGRASATLTRAPRAPYTSNVVTLEFDANSHEGLYTIAVTRGPVSITIEVEQRKH